MKIIKFISSSLSFLFYSIFATTISIPTDYPTIQEGIDAAEDGDVILIAQGTYYENLNLNKEITTMSVFNVTPLQAGKYFNKIECFCFEEQKLSPNEEVEMPVSFFIDPEIKNDKFINEISEITLSYTMFIREEN